MACQTLTLKKCGTEELTCFWEEVGVKKAMPEGLTMPDGYLVALAK